MSIIALGSITSIGSSSTAGGFATAKDMRLCVNGEDKTYRSMKGFLNLRPEEGRPTAGLRDWRRGC